MEPILNLFNCFTEETAAGEVKAHLEATGQRIAQDGSGQLTLVAKQSNRVGYDNPVLEVRRQRAIAQLGDKYLCHPSRRIQREVVSISARTDK